MLTTPMVARFHSSAASSSATETLKLMRSRSFKLRTTCLRSLIDCAASMWSSRVRKAIGISFEFQVSSFGKACIANSREYWKPETENLKLLADYFGSDPRRNIGLDDGADLDVAIIRERDAALHPVGDFFCVVFDAPQRSNLAFDHDHVVAEQAN